MTLTIELPQAVADRLSQLPENEINPFAVTAIAESLGFPQGDEVSSVRRGLSQAKAGSIRPASEFFAAHRAKYPEPVTEE